MSHFQKQNCPSGEEERSELNLFPDLPSLKAFLHPSYPGRVVTLGIGNRLMGDDGAGPELVTRLRGKWGIWDKRIFIDVGESPEDWFIRILELHPRVLIVIDAVALEAEAGSVAVLEPRNLPESLLFSTHRLPLKSLLRLWGKNECKTLVLAIQPESLNFGQGLSLPVEKSIRQLTHFLSPSAF